jgi:hypothetical protein
MAGKALLSAAVESLMPKKLPEDVRALYDGVAAAMDADYGDGRKVGNCKYGVYLFYDYDGEPIYVGQTRESLRNRIRRHLTNQRTDAVAMSVLDPFEVAEIEIWPYWELDSAQAKETLDRAEFTIYQKALRESNFGVVLNEKDIKPADVLDLPISIRISVLPVELRKSREHPDIRLARRARTIANLARVISERKVTPGIRRTLWAQARRLEHLAKTRLEESRQEEEP